MGSGKRSKKGEEGTDRRQGAAAILMRVNIAFALLATLYMTTVFSDIPGLSDLRDIWIETAMTTADHQWLATRLFPGWLVDRVMSRQVVTEEGTISNPDLLGGGEWAAQAAGDGGADGQTDGGAAQNPGGAGLSGGSGVGSGSGAGADGGTQNLARQPGLGGLGGGAAIEPAAPTIRVGDKDEFGNKVIVRDEAEDLTVIELRTAGYVGRLMIVSDPSRVVVRHTRSKGSQGQLLSAYLKEHDAIAGMNGNGFDDPEGHGKGGVIIGWSVADGKVWGNGSKSEYASVGLNDNHTMVVGIIKDFEKYRIRDLAQYGPTLIADGKTLVKGSAGWGMQPRTAIGQRADGTIVMATFDGRQPGHSLGISAGEVAAILADYGCVNAGLCDGGSSSVMMYDGEIIGSPSTPMKTTGRYLPNAFLVLRKDAPAGTPEKAAQTAGAAKVAATTTAAAGTAAAKETAAAIAKEIAAATETAATTTVAATAAVAAVNAAAPAKTVASTPNA